MTSKAGPGKPMASIPKEWEWVPLGKMVEITYGLGNSIDRSLDEGIPMISLTNVSSRNRLNLESCAFAQPSMVKEQHILKPGDILFNWRNGSQQHLGKSAIFNEEGRFAHVGFLLKIRTGKRLNPQYLYHYLRFIKDIGYFMNVRRHVNNTFNKKELVALPTIMPSPREQQFMALSLSVWDRAVDHAEKALKNALALKTTILANYFSGVKRGASFQGADWPLVRLSDFVKRVREKFRLTQKNQELACIELEHLEQGTGRLLDSNPPVKKVDTKYAFRADDVLFGGLRPYLKKFYLAEKSGICSLEFWVLRGDPDLCCPAYLYYLVQSPSFMWCANHGDGSSLPRSNWGYVASFLFPLPSLEEQRYISNCLLLMDRYISVRRNYLEKLYLAKSKLRVNLVSGKKRIRI